MLMKLVVEHEEKVLRERKRRLEVRVGCGVSRVECGSALPAAAMSRTYDTVCQRACCAG